MRGLRHHGPRGGRQEGYTQCKQRAGLKSPTLGLSPTTLTIPPALVSQPCSCHPARPPPAQLRKNRLGWAGRQQGCGQRLRLGGRLSPCSLAAEPGKPAAAGTGGAEQPGVRQGAPGSSCSGVVPPPQWAKQTHPSRQQGRPGKLQSPCHSPAPCWKKARKKEGLCFPQAVTGQEGCVSREVEKKGTCLFNICMCIFMNASDLRFPFETHIYRVTSLSMPLPPSFP